MKKKVVTLVTALILMIFITGCDGTGSLSKREKSSLMDFLVNKDYIDCQMELSTDGVGEGELHNYYGNVSVNGIDYSLYVQQTIRQEDYRIFNVSIRDSEENEISYCDVKIDRETGTVSLYEK